MIQKPKLLYIAPSASSFIQQDVKHLRDNYDVVFLTDKWNSKSHLIICFIKQFFLLIKHIKSTEKIICSFAGYSSYLPCLFGNLTNTNTGIIINGTDAVSLPSYNYGLLRKSIPKWFIKKSYEWATILLPVSESLIYSESNFDPKLKGLKIGIKHFFKGLVFDYKVIPNGFDTTFWNISNSNKKKNSFIAVMNASQFFLKGGDLIVSTAKKTPQATFYIVGMTKPSELIISSNVIFLGRLTPEDLKQKFIETEFVLQLSAFEGFGCSLCEAMLCGCIPIVSSVNELPNIVGKTGEILDIKSEKKLLLIIQKLLIKDLSNLNPNKKISEHYNISFRIQLLTDF